MNTRKKVILLGATGSIGTSTLKLARELPELIDIVGIAAANSDSELAKVATEFNVPHVAIYNEDKVPSLKKSLPTKTKIYSGKQGLIDIATLPEADMVLVAIVGTAGLLPTLAAIEAGRDIALASKEILVMGGEIVMTKARENNVKILPVDSEHNAIFQCLEKDRPISEVKKLILTASGGPFRKTPASRFSSIRPSDALAHPTWNMGKKISIDSATLFNKGLEMIEAKWLFDLPMEKIDTVVHPQSIIHSMVEYVDGSIIAQMSQTDMCFPIQYAITYPVRLQGSLPSLDLVKLAQLNFEQPRKDDFPALEIAIQAGILGGTAPAIMNAANEVAVEAFILGKISFPQIWQMVKKTLEHSEKLTSISINDLIAADQLARIRTNEFINSHLLKTTAL